MASRHERGTCSEGGGRAGRDGALVAAVVGSGIAAERLSDDPGLQLLQNSIATGAVLVALILALHPVSASFNPVVTVVEAALGRVAPVTAGVLVVAQVLGALGGVVLANLMFELLGPVTLSGHARGGGGQLLGEVVATAGLVLVVFGTLRTERPEAVAVAVGAYIAAAYWFTSSTSFDNPAVTAARTPTDTFAGIAPTSMPWFVIMQVVGGALGAGTVFVLHPREEVQV